MLVICDNAIVSCYKSCPHVSPHDPIKCGGDMTCNEKTGKCGFTNPVKTCICVSVPEVRKPSYAAIKDDAGGDITYDEEVEADEEDNTEEDEK